MIDSNDQVAPKAACFAATDCMRVLPVADDSHYIGA